ncbi:MAG: UDP-3-O-(3-hydroxymyristoyl)glucosamine N-acyltransferase [bacterium]
MTKTLDEIAKFVNGKIIGDKNIPISRIASLNQAKKGDITFITSEKELKKTQPDKILASAIILPEDKDTILCAKIIVDNPKLALSKLLELFIPTIRPPEGIHPTAVIGKDVEIGKKVSVGAYCVIGDSAKIKDNVSLYPLTSIGNDVVIGKNSVIHPNVTIYEKVTLGEGVIIHSGSVIGSDGFGYVKTDDNQYVKILQKGNVLIEDNVEIGACVTIDRATIDSTIIGRGTKIDNLVHIGHNAKIGKNCIIVAQVGISGSVTIEDNVTLAGQSGVSDHVVIQENTIVAARAGVIKNIGPNLIISGFPAQEHHQEIKIKALTQKLPEIVKKIKELEKRIEKIETAND